MNITQEEFLDAIFRAYDQGYARGKAESNQFKITVMNDKSHIPNYNSGMASGLSYMSNPYTEGQ